MTLTQLEYIVAVDTHRHFLTASKKCFVTQPTLSMQIQKLESELGIKIFDRSKQPVMPTDIGAEIIARARVVLREAGALENMVMENGNVMQGELRLAIIPTLAPYLLPFFLGAFTKKYPLVKLKMKEAVTEDILSALKKNMLDAAIIVTPTGDKAIKERVLFYEEFFVYVGNKNILSGKKAILPRDIDPDSLLLLEEGHCLRSQIYNICELRKGHKYHGFDYETGSLETLKKIIEKENGVTILPELATLDIPPRRKDLLKKFASPPPFREISLVTHRDYMKTKIIRALEEEIKASVPEHLLKVRKNVVPI